MTGWNPKKLAGLRALYSKAPNLSETQRSLLTPRPSTRKPRSDVESEHRAQCRLVQWLWGEGVPFFSVPNGANVSVANRQTLIAEGMQAGVPDLIIPRARGGYHGLYLELKREDGGSGLSAEQKQWLRILKEEGYCAVKCDGYDKAKEFVEWYLSLDDFSVLFKDIISGFMNLWRTTKNVDVPVARTKPSSLVIHDF